MKKLLVGVSLILLTIGGFLFAVHQATQPRGFAVSTVEKTISWTDGPDVELNGVSLDKLNAEVDQLIQKTLPGTQIHYRVISLGKRWVEVMYVGSSDVPEALQKLLNDFIRKRLPELAREQQGH